jgi:hypothetical protein
MNICSNCGVELDENVTICPLCGNKPGDLQKDLTPPGSYPSDIIRVYKKEVRSNIWELTGIIAISGIIVCTIVDLVIGRGLKWSLYVDISLLSAWITLSILLTELRKYYFAIPGLMLNILILLFLIDLISQGAEWFLPLGLPVTLAFFISVSVIVVLRKVFNIKGFSILGFSFLMLTIFCIITEVFLDKYLFETVEIHWSVIAGAAIFPIALILFFVHFRMKRGKQLDSFFHV